MITVSLKDFILTGKFGPVHTGMTMDEVIDILGIPGSVNHFQVSTGINYAWYEFFFDPEQDNRLTAIQNDHLMHTDEYAQGLAFANSRFSIDTWLLETGRNISRNEIMTVLEAENIPWENVPFYDLDIIKLESGVTLDFDVVNGEEVLNGIRYFPR